MVNHIFNIVMIIILPDMAQYSHCYAQSQLRVPINWQPHKKKEHIKVVLL